jgi:hypothetical protein
MARPTDLTSEMAKKLASSFRDGASVRVACGLAGIDPSTYYDWMARGRAGEPKFGEFHQLMKKARAQPEIEAYQAIRKAFLTDKDPDWKAAAKYIELKDPNRWKREQTTPNVVIDTQDLLKQAEERRKSKGGE